MIDVHGIIVNRIYINQIISDGPALCLCMRDYVYYEQYTHTCMQLRNFILYCTIAHIHKFLVCSPKNGRPPAKTFVFLPFWDLNFRGPTTSHNLLCYPESMRHFLGLPQSLDDNDAIQFKRPLKTQCQSVPVG